MKKLLLACVILLPLAACKPDCAQLQTTINLMCATDQTSTACIAAKLAYKQSGCKEEGPTCPSRCPAGQECTDPVLGCQPIPPRCPEQCEGASICTDPAVGCRPVTCQDLQCPYGCDEMSTGSVCRPKPPTTCDPACAGDEKCVEHGSTEKYYVCEKIPGPPPAKLIPDEELTATNVVTVQMWGEVSAAINRWKTLHAERWREDGACLIDGAAGIDGAFEGIATELARQSIIAGQSITIGGQRSDALFVNRPGTQLYEEWHLFDYARGCVATGTNAMKGVYRRDPVEPTPPPVSDFGCPAPQPEREWTAATLPPGWGQDQIGKPRWQLQSSTHGQWIDTTAATIRNEPYGAAIGMSPMADGTPRATVPMRPEGPTRVNECAAYISGVNPYGLTLAQCESARSGQNRVECERYIAQGDWVVVADGGAECEVNPSNSAQFRHTNNEGTCRLCEPGRVNDPSRVCTSAH